MLRLQDIVFLIAVALMLGYAATVGPDNAMQEAQALFVRALQHLSG